MVRNCNASVVLINVFLLIKCEAFFRLSDLESIEEICSVYIYWCLLLQLPTLLEQMLLRDPLDDNVIPIVKELQRRLAQVNEVRQLHGEDEERPEVQNDGDIGKRTLGINPLPCIVIYLVSADS